jgi:hypothetical protein
MYKVLDKYADTAVVKERVVTFSVLKDILGSTLNIGHWNKI